MNIKDKAYQFAQKRHEGQFRRDGSTPYFKHCQKVASLLGDDTKKAVALCHDLIEDGKATKEEIADSVSMLVADYVTCLTHCKGQSYTEYINNINLSGSGIVKQIKIADIVSNLSDKPSEKQVIKYNDALRVLANC